MARDSTDPVQPTPPTHAQSLLFVWLSPAFPVGAYAYSHGLEAAVSHGRLATRRHLEDWLDALLAAGSIRNDMILVCEAWRRANASDGPGLAEVNALALALQPSAERYLETSQQGNAFVAAVSAAWPCASLTTLRAAVEGDIAYAVAVAAATAGHGVGCTEALRAFALAVVQALVSAAIRLSVIGQTDGLRIVSTLTPAVEHAIARAAVATLDDLGGAAFAADLAALEHETLYTRLFRS